LTAERFALALTRAGVPKDVIQVLHLSPELTSHAVQHKLVDFVSFTGSVNGGREIERAAVDAKDFKGVALEVGLHLLSDKHDYWLIIHSLEGKIQRMLGPTQISTIPLLRSPMVSIPTPPLL
jgi:hypothetical protein